MAFPQRRKLRRVLEQGPTDRAKPSSRIVFPRRASGSPQTRRLTHTTSIPKAPELGPGSATESDFIKPSIIATISSPLNASYAPASTHSVSPDGAGQPRIASLTPVTPNLPLGPLDRWSSPRTAGTKATPPTRSSTCDSLHPKPGPSPDTRAKASQPVARKSGPVTAPRSAILLGDKRLVFIGPNRNGRSSVEECTELPTVGCILGSWSKIALFWVWISASGSGRSWCAMVLCC
jgi:hypothetical protein